MQKKIIPIALLLSQVISCSHNPTAPVKQRNPSSEAKSAETEKRCLPLKETTGSPWTTWSDKQLIPALIELKGMRDRLFECNLRDPHLDYNGYREVNCSKTNTMFRSADGSCNDLRDGKELVGASGVAFGRNVDAAFIDPDAPEKVMTPDPAQVSKEFFSREEFKLTFPLVSSREKYRNPAS